MRHPKHGRQVKGRSAEPRSRWRLVENRALHKLTLAVDPAVQPNATADIEAARPHRKGALEIGGRSGLLPYGRNRFIASGLVDGLRMRAGGKRGADEEREKKLKTQTAFPSRRAVMARTQHQHKPGSQLGAIEFFRFAEDGALRSLLGEVALEIVPTAHILPAHVVGAKRMRKT